MTFYHGTMQAGLTELESRSKDHGGGGPVVYATASAAYALVYIRDLEIDWVTAGVDAGGVVRYDERFEDQLRVLYQGVSGYVYTLTDSGFEPTAKRGVWVSRTCTPVASARFVPDVYTEMLECEARGALAVNRFSALSPDARQANHDTMVTDLYLTDPGKISACKAAFYQTYFAEAWEHVQAHPEGRAQALAQVEAARSKRGT